MVQNSAPFFLRKRGPLIDTTAPRVPETRPRKKQAVTKALKGSTIALIRQNATSSPLLSLPSELRQRIIKFLVGDKLIHVRYLNGSEEAELNACRNQTKRHPEKRGSFRHAVCPHVHPLEAQKEACGGLSLHKDCAIFERNVFDGPYQKPIIIDSSDACPIHSALVILSVCRQLYEESNYILWATNIFSFDHSASLISFVTSLNPAQKRNMKKMHIIVNSEKQECYWDEMWQNAWTSKYLTMFRGLESLSLYIEHELWHSTPFTLEPMEPSPGRYNILWQDYLNRVGGLVPLRVLPIKQLNLVINDATPKRNLPFSSLHYLPEELKMKHAERLRKELLDPQGADIQKAVDAKATQKRREEAAIYRKSDEARRLETAQRNVESARERHTMLGVRAVLFESEAHRARQTLTVGSHDEEACERLDARARRTRAAADKAADSLKTWEDRLSQRQKLADARAAKEAKAAANE